MNKQMAYKDDYGKIVAIRDDYGVLWIWGPNRFFPAAATDDKEWYPDTGYTCEPFNVEEAADILLDGGFITKEMKALLYLTNMDW